jgi:hypothetical protein
MQRAKKGRTDTELNVFSAETTPFTINNHSRENGSQAAPGGK